jgi:hypothetical protein
LEPAAGRFQDAHLPGVEAEPTRRIADGGCGGCRDQAEGIVIPQTLEQGGGRLDDQKPFPFQYSVHKWDYKDQELTIDDSKAFLEFTADGMDKRFLQSLIEILGNEGPIFTHNSSTEVSALKRLVAREGCMEFKGPIDNIIDRTNNLFHEDTRS